MMHPRLYMHVVVKSCAALLLAAMWAVSASGRASATPDAGGKLGFASPEHADAALMLGGHLEFAQTSTRLRLVPSLLYWKADRSSELNPSFDVYYPFASGGSVTPYLGGGLGLNMRSSEVTDRTRSSLGANLIGGFQFPGESHHYFVEGRYTASEASQVALLGGITFHAR